MRTASDLPEGVRELVIHGRDAWQAHDYVRAQRLFEQALDAARELRDSFAEMSALHFLGNVAFNESRDEESRRLHLAALELARRDDDAQGIATSLGSIALIDVAQRQFDQAATRFADAAVAYERAGMDEQASRVRETADALLRQRIPIESLVHRSRAAPDR